MEEAGEISRERQVTTATLRSKKSPPITTILLGQARPDSLVTQAQTGKNQWPELICQVGKTHALKFLSYGLLFISRLSAPF